MFLAVLVASSPLAAGRRGRALARFFAWQLWRRTGRSVQVSFTDGAKLYLPPWSTLAGFVVAVGSHEPDEQVFLQKFVRPGDVVVDVGANIGIYTVALVAAGAVVHAYEPVSATRDILEHNVKLNRAESTVTIH